MNKIRKIVKWDEEGSKKYREELEKKKKCKSWNKLKKNITASLLRKDKRGNKGRRKILGQRVSRKKAGTKKGAKKTKRREKQGG